MCVFLLQVLVTHGGVEMGQGLHIKMAQVAAHELGVPVSKVFIAETSTDKVCHVAIDQQPHGHEQRPRSPSNACASTTTAHTVSGLPGPALNRSSTCQAVSQHLLCLNIEFSYV